MTEKPLLPFLKWAGGKRWLATNYKHLLPATFDKYREPFVGGGAIFFALEPSRAILSDSNERLIECYQVMRDQPQKLMTLMRRHQRLHSSRYYYEARSVRPRSPLRRAAQFLYLNRTCWNGLYRVNLDGAFNVPRGTKNTVIFEDEDFEAYSRVLKRAKLNSIDFEEAVDNAGPGDVMFVDPPYTVKHNFNGFAKYNENIFSWNDQIRLRRALDRAASRDVKIVLSNADHESIIELFRGLGKIHRVHRTSLIASESVRRSKVTELLVSVNYDIDVPTQVNGEAEYQRLS